MIHLFTTQRMGRDSKQHAFPQRFPGDSENEPRRETKPARADAKDYSFLAKIAHAIPNINDEGRRFILQIVERAVIEFPEASLSDSGYPFGDLESDSVPPPIEPEHPQRLSKTLHPGGEE